MQVSAEVVIQRPVAEVFAYVADLQNAVEWAPGVLEAAPDSGGAGRARDDLRHAGAGREAVHRISHAGAGG